MPREPRKPREQPKRREPRPLRRIRGGVGAKRTRRYSREQIEATAESGSRGGYKVFGVIPGMKGRLLVRDKQGVLWSFSPVEGPPGRFHRQRIVTYGSLHDVISAIKHVPEKTKEAIFEGRERGKILDKKLSRWVGRRRARFPEYAAAEFELKISRHDFGLIYARLMNELNVRLGSWARANPFEIGLQEVRAQQGKRISTSPELLEYIHTSFPNEAGEFSLRHHGAGMTNVMGTCVFVKEEAGKPVIEIRDKSSAEPSRETGFISAVLESLLKEAGVKYSKKTE